jgi:Golgi nucleoside diphosphatase
MRPTQEAQSRQKMQRIPGVRSKLKACERWKFTLNRGLSSLNLRDQSYRKRPAQAGLFFAQTDKYGTAVRLMHNSSGRA